MLSSPESYLKRRTLIIGDVNSGKTRLTQRILENLVAAGHAAEIVLLDLAPKTTKGIGGNIKSEDKDVLLLTCPIVPPRLTGKNENEVQRLAKQNAQAIDPLIDQAVASRRTILFINDASLYLQVGDLDRLTALIQAFPTAIINAYYGKKFQPTPFTENEQKKVQSLFQVTDNLIPLSTNATSPCV